MNRVDGKIAVVTGGTQGLGAAIALALARAGAAGVVTCGRGPVPAFSPVPVADPLPEHSSFWREFAAHGGNAGWSKCVGKYN